MNPRLDYRDGFLCVLAESVAPDQSLTKAWYPVRAAEQVEVQTLLGCPLTEISPAEGIYVDEEGNVFQLADQGETPPLQVEQVAGAARSELETLLEASLSSTRCPTETAPSGYPADKSRGTTTSKRPHRKRIRRIHVRAEATDGGIAERGARAQEEPVGTGASPDSAGLNLRQKLALVRRRIAYVQKRGHNERRTTTM